MIDVYIFQRKQNLDSSSSFSVSAQMPDSRTLLTTLLVKNYHLQENQIQIAQNEYEKPYIIHDAAGQAADTASSAASKIDPHRIGTNGHSFFSEYPTGSHLLQPGTLQFSITHAGEATLIAISDQPIGIDAEQIAELSPDSISHFLSADEYAYCTKSTSPTEYADTLRTLEIWTKKEAISKYLGYGLNMDFGSFSVFDKTADYSLSTFVRKGMVISLCTATPASDIYWYNDAFKLNLSF